jgi:hypothetical protein
MDKGNQTKEWNIKSCKLICQNYCMIHGSMGCDKAVGTVWGVYIYLDSSNWEKDELMGSGRDE